jgi:GT2 family glycosyltransferase
VIDVVIPVYKGLEATRRCLESVLANPQATPMEVVVIDDATPDRAIADYLDQLAREGRITLERNNSNQGFVRSVNRGMLRHVDRDVVLLNSDTEVANDWLDRLHAVSRSAPDVATVTPFSNSATICSYPFEGWGGGVPGGLGLARLDRLFASTNAGKAVELPTAVGFCMYIRRDCLAQLGLFDAERFGRGYGEENDFCMRAGKAGWRNLLAGDVFVFHEGSVSFSGEKAALLQASAKALFEVHPDYPQVVHEFLVRDPPLDLRAAIDNARVALDPSEIAHVLAERADERAKIMSGLWHIERLATERDSTIGQLNRGLVHATALIAERDRIIAERDAFLRDGMEETAKLREGLRHAESLAFERQAELERIHSRWWWRCLSFVRRRVLLMPPRGVS